MRAWIRYRVSLICWPVQIAVLVLGIITGLVLR